jgi:hypothetical protein
MFGKRECDQWWWRFHTLIGTNFCEYQNSPNIRNKIIRKFGVTEMTAMSTNETQDGLINALKKFFGDIKNH